MRELLDEREVVARQAESLAQAPRIDSRTALSYRSEVDRVMVDGSPTQRKEVIRSCVDHIALTPDTLEVEIHYKIPGAIGALSGSGRRAYYELSAA